MVGHHCASIDRRYVTATIEEIMYFPDSDFEDEPDSMFINYVRNIAVRKCTISTNYEIQDEDSDDLISFVFYIFSLTTRSIYTIARPDNVVNSEFAVTHVLYM